MPEDLKWIGGMDRQNFLAIYDVAQDIEGELNICAEPITIPLFQAAVKFGELLPVDSVGSRDRYCELRAKAISFLEKKGLVQQLEYIEGAHRWELRFHLRVDELPFRAMVTALNTEFQRRSNLREASATRETDRVTESLQKLFDKFHSVAVQLRNRRSGRAPFEIADEYDVQDLLGALLHLFFEDVRREEWGPSHAGRSTRVDFLLKEEETLIEVKKTRPGLSDKEIGEQIIIDIEHYRKRQECKYLICFIYDPDHLIKNPKGLTTDLYREEPGFQVELIIRPER